MLGVHPEDPSSVPRTDRVLTPVCSSSPSGSGNPEPGVWKLDQGSEGMKEGQTQTHVHGGWAL